MMGAQLTKIEAEEKGKCKGCVSYCPVDILLPIFHSHCRATVRVDRYMWCPKGVKEDKLESIRVPKSKPKRKKVEPANKQVTIKEYMRGRAY